MIKTPEAKQLCNKTELELFTSSLSRSIKRWDEKELQQRVVRARRVRDKFRALAQRQRRESRGKQVPRGRRPSKSSQRTVRKHQLFTETLDRYEKRLAALRRQGESSTGTTTKKKPAKKKTKKQQSSSKKVARKRPASKKATKRRAKKKTGKNKKKTPTGTASSAKKKGQRPKAKANTKPRSALKPRKKASGAIRKQKHLSGQGRRSQARRDAR